jgi:hypothetical protein
VFEQINWKMGAYGGLAVGYWVLVLALPENSNSIPWGVRLAIAILGLLILLVGGWQLHAASRGPNGNVALSIAIVVFGLAILITAGLMDRPLSLDGGRRFALGVGGLALATLIIGIQQFKTVRAAGSSALIVLFVGVATWPGVEELMSNDVRLRVLTWSGIVLGVSVVAEAGKQAVHSNATARSAAAAIAAGGGGVGGDAASPGGFAVGSGAQASTPDVNAVLERLESFSLPDPPGDIR